MVKENSENAAFKFLKQQIKVNGKAIKHGAFMVIL